MGRSLAIALLLVGCGGPLQAPEELDELSGFIFEHQADGSEALMAGAMRNLEAAVTQLDLDGRRLDRSWTPDLMTEETLAGLETPDGADPANAIVVGLVARTSWEAALHAELATLEDQSPAEPSAVEYTRTFLEPTEPDCFGLMVCPELLTVNDIVRETAIYNARFELWKGFRAIEVDGRDALISRAWMEKSVVGEEGNMSVSQAYTIDVVMDTDDGPLRVQVLWSETDLGVAVSQDVVRATMRNGIDGLFTRTDEAIEELLVP